MNCLRSRASQPKGDSQILQLGEETPGLGWLILGEVSYRTPSSRDVDRLSEMINDDILPQNGINGQSIAECGTIFLHRSVGLIIGTLHSFLGKVNGLVFTEGSSLSFGSFDLQFDRRWLADDR